MRAAVRTAFEPTYRRLSVFARLVWANFVSFGSLLNRSAFVTRLYRLAGAMSLRFAGSGSLLRQMNTPTGPFYRALRSTLSVTADDVVLFFPGKPRLFVVEPPGFLRSLL